MKRYQNKTKAQLIIELEEARKRIVELEATETDRAYVKNTLLDTGEYDKPDEVVAFQRVSQAMSGSLDLETVASLALEPTLRILGLDSGSIRYLDEATQELVLLNRWNVAPELAPEMITPFRVKLGQGISGTVAQMKEPLVVEDLTKDLSPSFKEWNRIYQCYIGIPLKVKDRVVGVVTGFSRSRRTFTPGDMEMMASLGNMVGMAIANARLFNQVEIVGEELARSNADLRQFASVASHDLQEPLRNVASFVQLLARRYRGRLDADADEFIGYAMDGATRMQAMINDLLEYSRLGTQGKQMEPTDSSAVLDLALDNLKLAVEESDAEVTRDALPTVTYIAWQLAQLFQNLISNSIKFHGQEPPRVHISAERKGDEWVFSVRDNGIGLNTKFADRIFIIFQRLHTVGEYPGTGMGLAICKKIAERHGGRIWVESEPGKGSTFYFSIPVRGDN